MNSTFKISCLIEPQGEPLGFEIWCDDQCVFNQPSMVLGMDFEHECDDTDNKVTEIKFVLKHKTPEHTKISQDGAIVSDSMIAVKNFTVDGISVDQILYNLAEYQHDFNGTGAQTTEKFYGTLGCNGTVSLKLTSPIYLWLLENI